jgi:hypothetical protein
MAYIIRFGLPEYQPVRHRPVSAPRFPFLLIGARHARLEQLFKRFPLTLVTLVFLSIIKI